jgi:predicted nucleic-acid-binding protein
MTGLDTSVLVRLLVEDDAEQTAGARALVQRAGDAGEPLFVSELVACELVWVLESAYGFRREEIAGALAGLLDARQLLFRDRDALRRSLESFGDGGGDFSDYVGRELALQAGCESVATFDRALLREAGFVRP